MNGAQLADVLVPVLVGSTVRATILLAFACVAAALLRRASAAVRHRVWALALCGLIAVPVASLLPGWQLPRLAAPARFATAPSPPTVRPVLTVGSPRSTPLPSRTRSVPAQPA